MKRIFKYTFVGLLASGMLLTTSCSDERIEVEHMIQFGSSDTDQLSFDDTVTSNSPPASPHSYDSGEIVR